MVKPKNPPVMSDEELVTELVYVMFFTIAFHGACAAGSSNPTETASEDTKNAATHLLNRPSFHRALLTLALRSGD